MLERKELGGFFITTLILAFILSFRNWGVETFDLGAGLQNLVMTFILVSIALDLKVSLQKRTGHSLGYDSQYMPWEFGLFIGLILAFVSNGIFVFLALGGSTYKVIQHLRISHQHEINYKTMAEISAVGILASLALAMIGKTLFVGTGFVMFDTFMKINLWLALYGILPLPLISATVKIENLFSIKPHISVRSSDGLFILYSSRLLFVFMACLVGFGSLTLLFMPVVWSIIISLFFTVVCLAWYYVNVEQKLVK